MTHSLAPHLRPSTEAEIEAAISELFIRHGWYPVKTDAGMIRRGSSKFQRGYIRSGFPDMIYLKGNGAGSCLAVLIETKTATGKLSAAQKERHAELKNLYGIHVHVVRDPAEALAIIQSAASF